MIDSRHDVRALADRLHEQGGVPRLRAQVVALRAQGLSYRQIADELGLSDYSKPRKQVEVYKREQAESEWLIEHGPEL